MSRKHRTPEQSKWIKKTNDDNRKANKKDFLALVIIFLLAIFGIYLFGNYWRFAPKQNINGIVVSEYEVENARYHHVVRIDFDTPKRTIYRSLPESYKKGTSVYVVVSKDDHNKIATIKKR